MTERRGESSNGGARGAAEGIRRGPATPGGISLQRRLGELLPAVPGLCPRQGGPVPAGRFTPEPLQASTTVLCTLASDLARPPELTAVTSSIKMERQ